MGKILEYKYTTTMDTGFEDFFKKVGISKADLSGADLQGREAAGKYLLDSVVGGSANNPLKPPMDTGALRASGSAHIANNSAFYTTDNLPVSAPGQATPNKRNARGTRDTITVGINTPYAARWHENQFQPGEISLANGPVGPFYLSSHLQSDSKEMLRIYAMFLSRVS